MTQAETGSSARIVKFHVQSERLWQVQRSCTRQVQGACTRLVQGSCTRLVQGSCTRLVQGSCTRQQQFKVSKISHFFVKPYRFFHKNCQVFMHIILKRGTNRLNWRKTNQKTSILLFYAYTSFSEVLISDLSHFQHCYIR